jgi:DNA repair photolyase
MRGRGSAGNPADRFTQLLVERDPDAPPDAPATVVLRDSARSILAANESPDVPFEWSLNPYRGCEHGCIYCYARPTHEWLGLSAGLDFETRLFAKEGAAALLERELAAPSWRGEMVAISGVTDAWQPVERTLRLTRGCLEVLARARNPTAIVTKSALVLRDLDLLLELERFQAAAVFITVTTLDEELAATLEPRAARPRLRLDVLRQLAEAGIPTGVLVAPVIPGLTDHEIPAILAAARAAGVRHASWQMLRLPYGVKELFSEWLARHRPERRARVLHLLRTLRGGALNDARFGLRMRGEGPHASAIEALFRTSARRLGFAAGRVDLSSASFRRPGATQGQLFSA